MLRPTVLASVLAVSAAVLVAGSAAAAAPPSPPSAPPVSANTQPASVISDDQGQPAVAHCGAQASAAGNGYSTSPTQLSPSGTSSPAGCAGTTSTNAGPAKNTLSSGATGSAATAEAQKPGSGAATDLVPSPLVHAGNGFLGGLLWLGLLVLLALFLLLIGFAIGRRRQTRAVA